MDRELKRLRRSFELAKGDGYIKLITYVKGASSIKAKLTQTVDQLEDWAKELL